MPNIDHFTERSETSYTLAELLNVLKTHIDQRFGSRRLWVQGELSEFKQNPKSGHYYGELVEYGQTNSKQTRAKIRVMLWRQKAPFVLNKFYQTTGEKLQPSMKVLLEVQVHYHINYGLSLHIADIDPGFTLGDRESRKKKDSPNAAETTNHRQ